MSAAPQMKSSSDTAKPGNETTEGLKILVAEDSSITQDLIKLVLAQRGHLVDIVEDGEQALKALQDHAYDLALLDFHLPKLDGMEVLVQFLASAGDRPLPCFVAVTGDVEGLLAHRSSCTHFDRIIPKPLNVEEILQIVDEVSLFDGLEPPRSKGGDLNEPGREERSLPGLDKSDNVAAFPRSALSSVNPDLHFLHWPSDFGDEATLSNRLKDREGPSGYDGILIEQKATAASLGFLWQKPGMHLLPLIDMTGSLGALADVDASKLVISSGNVIEDTIELHHERSLEIHRDVLQSGVLADKLLARMHVSGRPLEPFYSNQSPDSVGYNMPLESRVVIEEASKLAESGFLDSHFFDRLHRCDGCGGSQFNVREECPVCRSSHLKEDRYLHHFKCAFQGPEADFVKGDELVCPKCRQRLTHFGSDYDKPGTIICCQACGHSTSEPDVGFVCLSCGGHVDGDAVQTRDVFGYSLNDKAIEFLHVGQSHLGFTKTVLKFSDLPLDLVVSLNEDARLFNEEGTPFALLEIGYDRARELEREHGPRQFRRMREQFLENLGNIFLIAQGDVRSKVFRGHSFDFALLHKADPERIRAITDDLILQAGQSLADDPRAKISVFGPGDLF